MFSFVRTWQSCLPKWLYNFSFPPAMNESSCCASSSLNFHHSHRCVVVAHCSFDLHFPDDMWGAFFHILICHLYILDEESFQIFCPLKKKSKTLTDASPKKIMSSGKCKLKQQFYTPIRMAKTSLHTYYNGQNPEHWQHQVLVKMWSSRKVYSLLMGLQNGTAT